MFKLAIVAFGSLYFCCIARLLMIDATLPLLQIMTTSIIGMIGIASVAGYLFTDATWPERVVACGAYDGASEA